MIIHAVFFFLVLPVNWEKLDYKSGNKQVFPVYTSMTGQSPPDFFCIRVILKPVNRNCSIHKQGTFEMEILLLVIFANIKNSTF